MNIIKNISIINYKSFLLDNFSLEPLTAIIGANESGKTNSLKAIYELSKKEQFKPFDNGDFRLGSPDFPDGEISIEYDIQLNEALIPNLINIEPGLVELNILIKKVGKLTDEPEWEAEIKSSCSNIRDVILINKNKTEFRKQLKNIISKNDIDTACKRGWLFKDSNTALNRNPFVGLLKNNIISRLSDDEKKTHLESAILDELLSNIKILFWKYNEENYLHERVSLEEFVTAPRKFSSMDNIFQIAGWKRKDYRQRLIDYDSTTRNNLLSSAENDINQLIKKHWTTHSKLTVKLNFEGDELTINLNEPGHVTPPNFRSDGFKWFLTFLLFFKRHADKSLENYILLIDEPGVFLHPRGQKDVLCELKSMSDKNQIIYSTHQTFLIDKNNPDSVRIIKREARQGVKSLYDSKVDTIKNRKNIFSDSLLRESLGFLVSDISPINEKNVLVEGGFDKDYIISANQKFKKLNLNEISVINCGKATNIKNHASLYLANNLKVLGLYESDEGGKSAVKSAVEKSEKFNKLQFKEVFNRNIETIEDLVPDGIYKKALLEWKKQSKITSNLKGERPRMKELNKEFKKASLSKEDKIELKHNLEDIMHKEIEENINKTKYDFSEILKLLNEIDKKIK